MKKSLKAKIIILIALVIATITFGTMAISTINSSKYSYYKSQYSECYSGYIKCKSEARTASYTYLKNLWEDMADDYYSLMQTWDARIEKIEGEATTYGVISIVFLFLSIGTVVVIIVSKQKAKQESEAYDDGANEDLLEESTEEIINEEALEAPEETVNAE